MRLLLAVALAALPMLARGQCLTDADAQGGVRVDFANGDVTTIRALGADMYQVDETFNNGSQTNRYHAAFSTYNFWYAPMQGGKVMADQETRVDWGMDLSDLPRPAADLAQWTTQVTESDLRGWTASAMRTVGYAAADPVAAGGCSYAALQVGVFTDWPAPGSPQMQVWTYLPDLGVSFITGWTTAQGDFTQTSVTAITALP